VNIVQDAKKTTAIRGNPSFLIGHLVIHAPQQRLELRKVADQVGDFVWI
jgi:hypothetical protein